MTQHNISLVPQKQPLYQVVTPQNSHPRLSLTRVLYVRFLRWVEKATANDLRKVAIGLGTVLLVAGLVFSMNFTLGVLTAAAKWNGYRIPLFLALLGLTLNARRIYRVVRRYRTTARGANQHTYQGIPVDELASYLIEQQSFKRDESMKRFAITQPKYNAIAAELKGHQVLIQGEHNAHVLNAITREQLVRQIREGFPLAFADGQWVERRGSYETFLRDKERSEQKERQRVEKLERRADKAQAKIKAASGFQRVLMMA